ncbi:Aste57867_13296 [Aphanomyces stellatus]|uniref:Aste57867_13296 protein n=1 Tax=Aphanomyces stellatus TaxID=120398 RepID=A0A485KYM1_9STRA|nr:hypothetical protein As57867_013247 [Aphanomyces stellatus]VFT90135.1 Aste57867_13296 [Aphanomyces stellatus]
MIGLEATPVARRRYLASMRMRKYREEEQLEAKRLRKELELLQEKHAKMKASETSTPTQRRNPFEMAAMVLRRHNQALREEASNRHQLARLLYQWVASQHHVPTPPASTGMSWIQTTSLLSNPLVRHEGMTWLSQRVYHTAQAASNNVFHGSMEDGCRFTMHTTDDDDGQPTVAGMECHVQHTFFANYKAVAALVWRLDVRLSPVISNTKIMDHVHDKLVYFCGVHKGTGSHSRRVLHYYDEPGRVIITHALVADDECFPVTQGEFQSRGFNWYDEKLCFCRCRVEICFTAIIERVTDNITLFRRSHFYMPATATAAAASLEDIGRLYGQSADGLEHRLAYIERCRRVVNVSYEQNYHMMTGTLTRTLAEQNEPTQII